MGLPAGVVTFLLTDIEGSTRLFQAFGDEYPALLDAHNAIVRDATAAHDGHEVSTEGDAFFLAFESPIDALNAAVTAQRKLTAYEWPDGGEIRVRMGMHVGEAKPTGDNYVALAVHQAARVSNAGHGGQILLSESARQLCDGVDDVTFVPLGPHVLKDFAQVEPLFQVAGDGLPTGFPALRTPTATTNLPRPRTAFIGRESELSKLTELTTTSRLVTLTGTGGTGKTRLATEFARRVVAAYDNGVVWVDLAARTDPDLVTQALAEALGLSEQTGRVLVHTIVDHLTATKTLVVIDNCEHLLDATAAMVEDLLDACEHIAVITTSREPLGVSGETVFRVPSLGADATDSPALELLLDRARQANASLTFDDKALEAARTICARLDGIPLAIELAASRLRGMSAVDLAARLEDRFALLSGGARGSLPRQQTLRGLVDWSYELLDERERAVFRRISVFSGRFPLAGVEAVCEGLGVDALEVMTRLVDKSLVNIVDTGTAARYQLLQTIRHYSFDRLLDSGEAADTRARHSDWCATVVSSLSGDYGDSDAGRATIDDLIEDVRATFEWCSVAHAPETGARMLNALDWYFADSGLFSEARRRGVALLEQLEADSLGWTLVTQTLQWLCWEQGDYAAAADYSERLLQIPGVTWGGEGVTELWNALNGYACALWRLGRLDQATEQLEAAMAATDPASVRDRFLLQHNRGLVHIARGDFDRAREILRNAIELDPSDPWITQSGWIRLGNAAFAEGSLDEADRWYAHSLAARTHGGGGWLEHYRGEVRLAQGRSEEAEALFAAAATDYLMFGNPNGNAYEKLFMGRAALQRGDTETARALTEEALATFEQHGDRSKIAEAHEDFARIAASLAHSGEAQARWQEAVAAWRRSGEELSLGAALIQLGDASITAGAPELAHEVLHEATAIWCDRRDYPISRRHRDAIVTQLDRLEKEADYADLAAKLKKRLEGIVGPAAV